MKSTQTDILVIKSDSSKNQLHRTLHLDHSLHKINVTVFKPL